MATDEQEAQECFSRRGYGLTHNISRQRNARGAEARGQRLEVVRDRDLLL